MTESSLPLDLSPPFHQGTSVAAAARVKIAYVQPQRVVRGLYIGRLALAAAVFLAVVGTGWHADGQGRMMVSFALVGAIGFTAASLIWTDLRQHGAGTSFLYLQVMLDMLLVTVAVHITWAGGQSQLSPLYILVIAVAALLVAPSGVPLVASFGMVMYFADAMLAHGGQPTQEFSFSSQCSP